MELKHTPGPWVKDFGVTRVDIHEDSGKMIVSVPRDDVHGRPFIETQANARLIAAAPDILEALIGLDDAFCSLRDDMTRDERNDARRKLIAARAAVAKATGAA